MCSACEQECIFHQPGWLRARTFIPFPYMEYQRINSMVKACTWNFIQSAEAQLMHNVLQGLAIGFVLLRVEALVEEGKL